MIAVKIAFSCTCQPNMKELKAHRTKHRTNCFEFVKYSFLYNKQYNAGCNLYNFLI